MSKDETGFLTMNVQIKVLYRSDISMYYCQSTEIPLREKHVGSLNFNKIT